MRNFFCDLADLNQINWDAVAEDDFRGPETKEGKQAEFLAFESFPWHLVEKIGVSDAEIASKASLAISEALHHPIVNIERTWYF